MWNLNSPYVYRDDNLKRMGFKSFRAYLKSALWLEIRRRVLLAHPLCPACLRQPATQVHHRAYDPATLRGEVIHSLSATCGRCHRKAERPHLHFQDPHDRLQRANRRLWRS